MAEAPAADGAATAVAAPAPAKRSTVRDWSTTKMTRTLRMANLCNGLVLITMGILLTLLGLAQISFTSITVSVYVIFFGLLMSCLECNISALAPKFQRNFGFMYSFLGRMAFIFFAGTMAFAMATWLAYIVGAVTMVNGLFNGYVICVHPAFRSGELSAQGDPYGGYTGGEKEMLDFLKKNPELATKAGGAAAQFAADNPQVAAQVLAGGAGGGAGHPNPWGK